MRQILILAVVALIGCSLVEGRAIRDVKSDLLDRAKALLNKADATIAELTKKDPKDHPIAVLQAEKFKINKVIAELNAATDHAKVIKHEHELNTVLNKLDFELKKLDAAETNVDVRKKKLGDRATALQTKAEEGVQKLTVAANQAAGGEIVKTLKELVTKIAAATTKEALDQFEKDVTAQETALADLLKKETAPPVNIDEQKNALSGKAKDLETKADAASKNLKIEENKTEGGKIAAAVKELETKITAAATKEALDQLEKDVAAQQTAFDVLIKKDAVDDQKKTLSGKAKELETKADTKTKTLTDPSKKTLGEQIVKAVKDLEAKIAAATTKEALDQFEKDVAAQQTALNNLN